MSCLYDTGTYFDRVFQAQDLQDLGGADAEALLRKAWKHMVSTGLGRKLNMSGVNHKGKLKGSSLVKLMYCKCTLYIILLLYPYTFCTLYYCTFVLHVYHHIRGTTHSNSVVIRFYSCSDVAKIKDDKVTEDTVMTQVKTLVGNSWAQERRELQQEKRKCDLSTKYPEASDSDASTPARPALNRSTSAQSDLGTPLPQEPTSPVASTSTSGIV